MTNRLYLLNLMRQDGFEVSSHKNGIKWKITLVMV